MKGGIVGAVIGFVVAGLLIGGILVVAGNERSQNTAPAHDADHCCPADGDCCDAACCDPCKCGDCKCCDDDLRKRVKSLENKMTLSMAHIRELIDFHRKAGKQPANPGRWIDMQPPANVGASGDAGPADAKE